MSIYEEPIIVQETSIKALTHDPQFADHQKAEIADSALIGRIRSGAAIGFATLAAAAGVYASESLNAEASIRSAESAKTYTPPDIATGYLKQKTFPAKVEKYIFIFEESTLLRTIPGELSVDLQGDSIGNKNAQFQGKCNPKDPEEAGIRGIRFHSKTSDTINYIQRTCYQLNNRGMIVNKPGDVRIPYDDITTKDNVSFRDTTSLLADNIASTAKVPIKDIGEATYVSASQNETATADFARGQNIGIKYIKSIVLSNSKKPHYSWYYPVS
jgi:hypothetical protein